jgi:SAM-dependent methyltransferase
LPPTAQAGGLNSVSRNDDGDAIAGLDTWYETPLGRHVAAAEARCVERLLADTFGHFLLQLGTGGQFAAATAASRIRHRIVVGGVAGPGGDRLHIAAAPETLPVAATSVDAVLLPHTLDLARDPHAVLREVDRVLIPEGRAVILGFNPISPWGLARLLPRRRRRVPWCGNHLTPFRVADRLRMLGLELEWREMLVFRPPVSVLLLRRLRWLDATGDRWWPLLGGVYALRAVKRLRALTPLRPQWLKRRPLLPGGAVKPTARERSHAECG